MIPIVLTVVRVMLVVMIMITIRSYLAHNAELRQPPGVVGKDNRIETPNIFLQKVSEGGVVSSRTEEPPETVL